MLGENIKLLFKLWYRPVSAMSDIIDRGDWFFGAALVTATAFLLAFTVTNRIHETYESAPIPPEERRAPRISPSDESRAEPATIEENLEQDPATSRRLPLPVVGDAGWRLVSFNPTSLFAIALSLAALYIPAAILALTLIARTGSFSVAFRRDYGSLLICSYMAWAASHLPFALAGLALNPLKLGAGSALVMWLLGNGFFGALMIIALRMVSGASIKHAAMVVGLAWVSLRFDSWLFSIATFSPFFTLIWGLPLALGAVYGVRAAHAQRQNFRRHLDACMINERDAEAHYQLGLIYQQRRQYGEAAARFKRAVEIDAAEPDANFELGRIARQEGRLQDAINHFNAVVAHSDKFRQSEVWREIGATYLAAGMHQEAHEALEKYVDRRPYDPEGLYHFGETLRNLGDAQRAREMYERCIQAVKTMPYYRRNEVSKWSKLAQAKLA
ncbi:MAG: tetratricopeptide repeat protein [Blastocatellia bacterium]